MKAYDWWELFGCAVVVVMVVVLGGDELCRQYGYGPDFNHFWFSDLLAFLLVIGLPAALSYAVMKDATRMIGVAVLVAVALITALLSVTLPQFLA